MPEDSRPTPSSPQQNWEDIRNIPLSADGWRESRLWVCATCLRPAFYNPHTDILWGCRQCGFVTDNIFVRFVSRRSLAKKDESLQCEIPVREEKK